MKVIELLTDEARYSRGEWARRQDGTLCHWLDDDAYSFDLRGACKRCYEGKELQKICDRIKRHLGVSSIEEWSDRTPFPVVRKLIHDLGI